MLLRIQMKLQQYGMHVCLFSSFSHVRLPPQAQGRPFVLPVFHLALVRLDSGNTLDLVIDHMKAGLFEDLDIVDSGPESYNSRRVAGTEMVLQEVGTEELEYSGFADLDHRSVLLDPKSGKAGSQTS
jgi:hypothetical protein